MTVDEQYYSYQLNDKPKNGNPNNGKTKLLLINTIGQNLN